MPYLVASLPLPLCLPLILYTVYCMWMCHGGDVRALPADLFMIWLLISFTGTLDSASQIGLQAPLCERVHVCVCDREKKKQNSLKYTHRCILVRCMRVHLCIHIDGVCVCAELAQACAIMFVRISFSSGCNHDKLGLWQSVFWASEEVDLMMIAYNRVVIELSDNSWKSLCNGWYQSVKQHRVWRGM